jgi:NADH:ubiquinone oxidoreductase subunit 4 (subunit M)
MNAPLLSLITFLPLAGAIILIFIPREEKRRLYIAAMIFVAAALILSLMMAVRFDGGEAGPNSWRGALGSGTGSITISAWTGSVSISSS